MSVMMRVSQMIREVHHGQVGGGLPATLAVTRVIFLGAPRPVVRASTELAAVAVDNFLPCM